MNIPKLKKLESIKMHHGIELKDEYSWVDQSNILEVLKDTSKLNPEVKTFIETKEVIDPRVVEALKKLKQNNANLK